MRAHNVRVKAYSAFRKQQMDSFDRLVLRYIGGLKGRRENPVSTSQVLRFFAAPKGGASEDDILASLERLHAASKVRLCRLSTRTRGDRRAYRWEAVRTADEMDG